jgi:hypothetical protein
VTSASAQTQPPTHQSRLLVPTSGNRGPWRPKASSKRLHVPFPTSFPSSSYGPGASPSGTGPAWLGLWCCIYAVDQSLSHLGSKPKLYLSQRPTLANERKKHSPVLFRTPTARGTRGTPATIISPQITLLRMTVRRWRHWPRPRPWARTRRPAPWRTLWGRLHPKLPIRKPRRHLRLVVGTRRIIASRVHRHPPRRLRVLHCARWYDLQGCRLRGLHHSCRLGLCLPVCCMPLPTFAQSPPRRSTARCACWLRL